MRGLKWTRSIAACPVKFKDYLTGVGSESFIDEIKEKLNVRAKGRKAIGAGTAFQLREPVSRYNTDLGIIKEDLAMKTPILGTLTQRFQGDSLARPRIFYALCSLRFYKNDQ